MRIWSDEELEFIRNLVVQGMDTVDIHERYKNVYGMGNRSYDSVQKKVKQFRDVVVDDLINSDEDESDNNDEMRLINIEEAMGGRVHRVIAKVPIEVKTDRGQTLAMRWIRNFSRAKKGKPMHERLAEEIIGAYKKEGLAVKKKEDTHKMAEANKAFSHYRW